MREDLASQRMTLIDSLSGISMSIAGEFERGAGNFSQRVEEAGRTMRMAGDDSRSRFISDAGALVNQVEAASDQMREMTRAAESAMRLNAEGLSERLTGATLKIRDESERVAGELDTRADRFADQLAEVSQRIAQMLESSNVGTEMAGVAETIRSELERASASMNDGVRAVASQIRGDVGNASQTLLRDAEAAGRAIMDRGGDLAEQFSAFTATLATETEKARAELAASSNSIGNDLVARIEDSEQLLSARARSIGDDLDQKTRSLAELLSARTAEIGRVLDEDARPLVERFDESGANFAQLVGDATRQASERLRAENAALVAALSQRAGETIESLARSSSEVLGEFEEKASGAVGVVAEIRDQMERQIGSLISRLSQTSGALRGLVGEAAENLGAIDATLSASGSRFSQNAEEASNSISLSARMLESNVDKLDKLSSTAFSKVAGIADRFKEHGNVLGEAVQLIEQSEGSLRATLQGGQGGLDELSSGLVRRSEEIGELLRSFEEVMDGLFDRTEQRSRLISAKLSSDVGETLSDAERKMQDAEARTQSTAEAMRISILSVIEDASQRFTGATDEIRRTAQEIRQELDETRGEIRKGVGQLPDETRESTEAMRRAVSDQIRALRDLSDVVSQSGRAFDIGGRGATGGGNTARPAPARQSQQAAAPLVESRETSATPRQMAPRQAPVAPVTPEIFSEEEEREMEDQIAASFMTDGNLARDLRGSNFDAAPRQPAASQNSSQPQARDPSPATAPAPQTGRTNAAGSTSAPNSPLRPAARPAGPQAAPTGIGRSGGWVSDLLRRASRDEDDTAPEQQPTPRSVAQEPVAFPAERPAAQVVDSLNSLSVDIARAIDHKASVELWERYRKGERNVFTRRLYTMKGQQTFDEIRRKYQRDETFKVAVDRYISDFEKLLGDVSQDDTDGGVGRGYLTSDTGKVYTMLAHASGRFDS